jgi:hypothetical protein
MKSYIAFLFLLSTIGFSCKKLPAKYINPQKTSSGKIEIYSQLDHVSLMFYGDYSFHKYSSKHLPNYNPDWSKMIYLGCKFNLIYTAHTTVLPYCSVIGLRYLYASRDSISDLLSNHIKTSGKSENLIRNIEQIGKEYFSVIDYDFYNFNYSRNTHFTEYLSQQGSHVYRIAFSTEDSNLDWFKKECIGVLESMEYR